MYSSFALIFLTILVSNLSYTVFAGDYPLIGSVLLQSAPQSEAFGTVTLTQKLEGEPVIVEGIIFNLKPNSRFGLHVHEQGDLTNACQSTGGHFNPFGRTHGSERSVERHWGDFGNIASDNLGNARVLLTIQEGSLIGADGYFGRALVLHEREDDLGLFSSESSRTNGNSGARIACGVIGIRRPIDRLPVPKSPQKNNNVVRQMSFVPTFRSSSPTVQTK